MISAGSIGIFDSGFGGLSIYKDIVTLLPKESTIYIGDHAYLPYGTKTRYEIQKRAKKLITFLLSKHAKLIVVACNTATIAGIDQYRSWFPSVPIIGVVPVIKTAAEISKKKSFAILSTQFTAQSDYQKKLINKFASGADVYNLGCPYLVDFVEKGITQGDAVVNQLKKHLSPEIIRSIDVVVLGCTHYPFLTPIIRAIVGKDMKIVDSGGAVARQAQRIIYNNDMQSTAKSVTHIFYSTKQQKDLATVVLHLLNKNIVVHYANI